MRSVLLLAVVCGAPACVLLDPPPPFDPDAVDAAVAVMPDAAPPVDAAVDAGLPRPPILTPTYDPWAPPMQELLPPNRVQADHFGGAVAISSDGRRIAVGAPNDGYADNQRLGSVRVFEDDGTGTFVWRQFIRPADVSWFGTTVAIEGDLLAITDKGVNTSTRVRIYRRDAGGVWQPDGDITRPSGNGGDFGEELRFDGTRLLVTGVGQVGIYQETTPGTWMLLRTLLPPPFPHGNEIGFGSSIALDGDRLVVGDRALHWEGDVLSRGGALVYDRAGVGWNVSAVLPPVYPASLGMGTTVAISGDDIAIHDGTSDRVETWRLVDGAWRPSAHVWLGMPNTSNWPFGHALVVTPELMLAGTGTLSNPDQRDSGHAFRFVRSGTTWMAAGQVAIPGALAGDNIGVAMAAAPAAKRIVIGASGDDGACGGTTCAAGAVYVITLP